MDIIIRPNILATDLDGTLIPLEGNEQNHIDLDHISQKVVQHKIQLVFVTGRHLESVLDVAEKKSLPCPDWIICDVGSSIYRIDQRRQRDGQPNTFVLEPAYVDCLQELLRGKSLDRLEERLKLKSGLRLQEPDKQGRFKLSFYTQASELKSLTADVTRETQDSGFNCQIISSIDPFNNDGLIDVLPPGINKAFALNWWLKYNSLGHEQVVYSGDSGNDLAALTAGYKTIVVGNATASLVDAVTTAHQKQQWDQRLFVANEMATSGVLEGCEHFGMFELES